MFFLNFLSLLCFMCWQITDRKDTTLTEMDDCRSQTREGHHKNHAGEWGGFGICTHQGTFSILSYFLSVQAFLQSYSSGGTPAMNPSSQVFSRQSNLTARHCVGIPPVWVLPTQNSQTAPEQKAWTFLKSLLCVVVLLSSVKLVCLPLRLQAPIFSGNSQTLPQAPLRSPFLHNLLSCQAAARVPLRSPRGGGQWDAVRARRRRKRRGAPGESIATCAQKVKGSGVRSSYYC